MDIKELREATIVCLKSAMLTMVMVMIWAVIASAETPKEVIASTISAEACGEGKQGMIAVLNTMINRAEARGTSIYKEATRKNQYYGYTAKNRQRLYQQCKKQSDEIVDLGFAGKLADITGGAVYFRTDSEPVYSWHRVKTVKIGQHIFYR